MDAAAAVAGDLPGGLASQVQMHMLSVDVGAALHRTRAWAPPPVPALCAAGFPAYAGARAALGGRAAAAGPAPRGAAWAARARGDRAVGDDAAPPRPRAARQRAARRGKAAAARTAAFTAGARLGRPALEAPARGAATVTSDGSSGGSSGGSEAGDDAVVGGFLRKKGRRTRVRVARFFTIDRAFLTCFRDERCWGASWVVDIAGAIVGVDEEKHRVVLLLDDRRKLVLYARAALDARLWAEAFAHAAECKRHVDSFGAGVAAAHGVSGPAEAGCHPVEDVSDPANDVWDTFRSFQALRFVNSRRKSNAAGDAGLSDVPPHIVYSSLA